MFDYTIKSNNSVTAFKNACEMIEHKLFPVEKVSLLIDVDGSTIQEYHKENKTITVYDDYDIGAVYIKSEIELKFLKS